MFFLSFLSLRSVKHVKPKLIRSGYHARPKVLESSNNIKLKALGSGMTTRPNYLRFKSLGFDILSDQNT